MSSVYKCKDGGQSVIGRNSPPHTVPCANKGGVADDSNVKWYGGEILPSPSDTPHTELQPKDKPFLMKYKWAVIAVAVGGFFLVGKQQKWF